MTLNLNPFVWFANLVAAKVTEQLMPKVADLKAKITTVQSKLADVGTAVAEFVDEFKTQSTDPVPQEDLDALDAVATGLDAIKASLPETPAA